MSLCWLLEFYGAFLEIFIALGIDFGSVETHWSVWTSLCCDFLPRRQALPDNPAETAPVLGVASVQEVSIGPNLPAALGPASPSQLVAVPLE
ncbi:hypothetical protein BDR26DRAFT_935511 [Obelidium mucronatum]|nr:hypothetical protein BDR26DRAFT_935511 [Obelidium mucronatum]